MPRTLAAMEDALTLLYEDLARGQFPPADGNVRVMRPQGRIQAVLAFTAHTLVVVELRASEVIAKLDPHDFGAQMSAEFLVWLGGRLGRQPGVQDCVLTHTGPRPTPGLELVARHDLQGHPRVLLARRTRDDVQVFSDRVGRGLVTLGRGLGGRLDLSFEVEESSQNAGLGRVLLAAALARCPTNEVVFAEVAPGNARSLRAVLACGFRPVGAEVLFGP